jgi:hypothetical protein
VTGLCFRLEVWQEGQPAPPAAPPRRANAERRRQCRADLVAALAARGRPMTRKELAAALRPCPGRPGHGAGTVAKAPAELTAAGQLVNVRDERGYRLTAWASRPPALFAD